MSKDVNPGPLPSEEAQAPGNRRPGGQGAGQRRGYGQRRRPKQVTLERLKRQAVYYLERYNASQSSLAQVLMRKVRRAAKEHPDTDMDQAREWVGQVVAECARIGLVNDENFALTRARSLLRGGKSLRAISMALRQKGIGDDLIDQAFERLRDEAATPGLSAGEDEPADLDRQAALAYARKRRLGIYRQPPDPDRAQKDLAAMARRGFGLILARSVLELDRVYDGAGDDEEWAGPEGW